MIETTRTTESVERLLILVNTMDKNTTMLFPEIVGIDLMFAVNFDENPANNKSNTFKLDVSFLAWAIKMSSRTLVEQPHKII